MLTTGTEPSFFFIKAGCTPDLVRRGTPLAVPKPIPSMSGAKIYRPLEVPAGHLIAQCDFHIWYV